MMGDCSDLVNLMNDTYAGFIAQRRGDTQHDESHIANGICCGLAANMLCHSQKITLNGTMDTEYVF